jgi:thioredoxin 1
MATNATTDTFANEVLESDGKVIVDFWAEWCGPCHAVAPVLDRIADEHQVKIVKVNIDHEQDLAQRYGVASIPFMVLFENGEPQASAIGAMPKGSLEKALGLAEAFGGGFPPPPAPGLRLVEEREEGEVLFEVRLEFCNALVRQAGEPVLGEVVLDGIQRAARFHRSDHPCGGGWTHEPFGPSS